MLGVSCCLFLAHVVEKKFFWIIRRASLLTAASACIWSVSAIGQTTTLGDEVSRPITGAGHDYIHLLSETVSPSNGSLSIKISLPSPHGRGISLPLAITYNSNEVHRFTSNQAGGGGFDASEGSSFWPTDRSQQGFGWSDTLPYATYSYFAVPQPGGSYYGVLGWCPVTSSYNFYDPTGASHQLGLAALGVAQHSESPSTATPGGCANIPLGSYKYGSRQTGGDDQVTAAMDSNCNGNYYQVIYPLDCGSAMPAFNVTDLNGTTYFFPANAGAGTIPWYGDPPQPASPAILFPTKIEDRNGNTISFTVPNNAVRAQPPLTDTVGRTISTSGNYVVGGLTYTLTHGTTGANFSLPNTQFYPIGQPSGGYYNWTCAANFSVNEPSSSLNTITSIALPNGQSYKFAYDPTYGLLNKITYPDGGWVSYTWGLPSTTSTIAIFDGANGDPSSTGSGVASGACGYQYSNPVIIKRQVGYSQNSAAAQTQTFAYTTTWDSTYLAEWDTKLTTVTTQDNVTGESYSSTCCCKCRRTPSEPHSRGNGNSDL
jgi:hypothetical protein